MTKKIIFIFLILFNTNCVKFIATGSEVVSKTSRLNREIIQVKNDLNIEKQIQKSIDKNKSYFLKQQGLRNFGRYYIDVLEGRVLLTGIVYNQEIKDYIINKITENLDVRELLDELKVGNVVYSNVYDFFLKRTIISKIFFKSNIKSLNYDISVVNGYVYIIGIAEDEQEANLIAKIISTVSGVKEVNSYIITINSDKKLKVNFTN